MCNLHWIAYACLVLSCIALQHPSHSLTHSSCIFIYSHMSHLEYLLGSLWHTTICLLAGQAADALDHQKFLLFLQSQASSPFSLHHSSAFSLCILHHSQAARALDQSDAYVLGTRLEHPALQLSAAPEGCYVTTASMLL